MQITYHCTGCEATVTSDFAETTHELACPECQRVTIVPEGAIGAGTVERCLVCPSSDLFVRKDFPQALGVTIIVIGFAASTVTWYYQQVIGTYAILFATALIDALLYVLMPNVLECYRCGGQYRGIAGVDEGPEFDLSIHEKHRQQEARLKQAT